MKALMIVIAILLVAAPCASVSAQTKATTPATAIEWTKVHEAESSAMRHSLFITEEGRLRMICHVYIADDEKSATVTLCVNRYSNDKKFVTQRVQYIELIKNNKSKYWDVVKNVMSGNRYETGRKRSAAWLEFSDEDLRWNFYDEFERAPIEVQRIVRSL